MKKARFRNGFQGKGFAAALVLSLTAVGVSTYAAYTSAMDKLTEGEVEPYDDHVFLYEEAEAAGVNQTDIPLGTTSAAEAPPATDATDAVDAFDETGAEEQSAGLFFSAPKTMPVEGEVINPYSAGELVKSETLDVWKTHDGADLAAEAGAAVASCMKGKVSEIKNDPLWGVCVLIDHGDGIVGHYYGLAETLNVKTGQEVAMGEIIAQVGNTADAECKLPSHLHFGITKNGEWIDPIAFIEK
ncbi:MAG: M23 family metallopeptidase [Bacteroides sp.]|nr:M23 family metallopeptidase [Eubacterium sp.]MCM1418422.1 M23 family metallopeptidase [Roseburia sp.]MCM1461556.1 M23 family metallopeptidase [Bacteroides sp.]